MEQRQNGLTYTHAGDVRKARVNYAGAYATADRGGYQSPGKRVTPYMVTLADGRERRVYAMAYGNGTVPYIVVKGHDVILSDHTQDALARMHASGEPFEPTRTHAEVVEAMRAEILIDARTGIVPASVTDYAQLHDFTDANMYGWREEDEGPNGWTSAEVGPAQDEIHEWLQAHGIMAALAEELGGTLEFTHDITVPVADGTHVTVTADHPTGFYFNHYRSSDSDEILTGGEVSGSFEDVRAFIARVSPGARPTDTAAWPL